MDTSACEKRMEKSVSKRAYGHPRKSGVARNNATAQQRKAGQRKAAQRKTT